MTSAFVRYSLSISYMDSVHYVQRFVENKNAGDFLMCATPCRFFFPDRLDVQIGCVVCFPSVVWMHFLHAEIRSTCRCGWNGVMKQLITGLTG